MNPKIMYTITDESPALATSSFLPIVRAFANAADIEVEEKDLSLAARILAVFPEHLSEDQQVPDDLKELGESVKDPDVNIIKLPNISASTSQLLGAIKELRSKGYDLPAYPEEPADDYERSIRMTYDSVKGSAVNPVLREGNSDRRVPGAVKAYAKKHPHSMGTWDEDSRTHIVSMTHDDFYHTEASVVLEEPCSVRVELIPEKGEVCLLKERIDLLEGEILDSAVMRKNQLRSFLEEQIADAKAQDVLLSIQLKASMMKISDPIIFGHMLSIYFKDVFETYRPALIKAGVNPDNGLKDLLEKISTLPPLEKDGIIASIQECRAKQADLAMVDPERGITSLDVPSDVLIDASIPLAIRTSGKMLGPDGKLKDVKMIIPDSTYSKVYENSVAFCKEHGAFDPRTMGSVSNIGLMAQKAEEYGSHDKTFLIPEDGLVKVIDDSGRVLMEQRVCEGDIFRMCQVKDIPIRDWVRTGVDRARESGEPAVFWLDEQRPHDARLIEKVQEYLRSEETEGLDLRILPPGDAALLSLERMKEGKNTISVTGNVLRDYLTDLFPILELGTSSKMLSIVSLLHGGVLFETGASGSAPMLVQQFLQEGHFQWNSLGEFLALTVSLERYGMTQHNPKALVLAQALDAAVGMYLEQDRAPSGDVKELDLRGSHFYLALYWAQALASQHTDEELKRLFSDFAHELEDNEQMIVQEFLQAQGQVPEFVGYYLPDRNMVASVMRPSTLFNTLLGAFQERALSASDI